MPRGVRDEGRAVRQRLIIESVLRRSRRLGWDDAYLTQVLMTSLRPARVQFGVVGPCFYCGTELADSVDHIHPVSDGGTDDRGNLVSACWPCNYLKGAGDIGDFLWFHPYGSDQVRSRRAINERHNSPFYAAILAEAMAEAARTHPDDSWSLPVASLSVPARRQTSTIRRRRAA